LTGETKQDTEKSQRERLKGRTNRKVDRKKQNRREIQSFQYNRERKIATDRRKETHVIDRVGEKRRR
jgi:hypothetical protein